MEKGKNKSSKKGGRRQIINLTDYRNNKNEERRREYERILFHRVLGVYTFAERSDLHHIEIIDISYSGIRLREPSPEVSARVGDKLALRFYFTPSSYLRIIVEVKRANPYRAEGREGMEYGCEIDKATKSYDALKELVLFMEKYSSIACQDNNPPVLWF